MINIGLCDISVLCAGTKKYPAVQLKKNPTVLSQGGRIESGLVLILWYAQVMMMISGIVVPCLGGKYKR